MTFYAFLHNPTLGFLDAHSEGSFCVQAIFCVPISLSLGLRHADRVAPRHDHFDIKLVSDRGLKQ